MNNRGNRDPLGGNRPKMTLAQVVAKFAPHLKPRVDALQRTERLYKELMEKTPPHSAVKKQRVATRPNKCYECGSKQHRTYGTDREGWVACECFRCGTEYFYHPNQGVQSSAGYTAIGTKPVVNNSASWAGVVKSNKRPQIPSSDWKKDWSKVKNKVSNQTTTAIPQAPQPPQPPKLSRAQRAKKAKELRAEKLAKQAKPITQLKTSSESPDTALDVTEIKEDKPIKVNGEIITAEALTASINQVLKTVDVSDDLPTYEQYLKDFRTESRKQPGEVGKWIKSAEQILQSWPTRLLVCTPTGVYRVKRDLESTKPYLLSYLTLLKAADLEDLDLSNWDQQISAAAMMVATKPLRASWRRAKGRRKTGGTNPPMRECKESSKEMAGT